MNIVDQELLDRIEKLEKENKMLSDDMEHLRNTFTHLRESSCFSKDYFERIEKLEKRLNFCESPRLEDLRINTLERQFQAIETYINSLKDQFNMLSDFKTKTDNYISQQKKINEWNIEALNKDNKRIQKVEKSIVDGELTLIKDTNDSLENLISQIDDLSKWESKNRQRIEKLESTKDFYISQYENLKKYVEYVVPENGIRIEKLESLIDIKKMEQIILDGANLHATILKFEARMRRLELYVSKIPQENPVVDVPQQEGNSKKLLEFAKKCEKNPVCFHEDGEFCDKCFNPEKKECKVCPQYKGLGNIDTGNLLLCNTPIRETKLCPMCGGLGGAGAGGAYAGGGDSASAGSGSGGGGGGGSISNGSGGGVRVIFEAK